MIAGVCAGVAAKYGWNVKTVRFFFILFGLVGAGEVVYLIIWAFTPNSKQPHAGDE